MRFPRRLVRAASLPAALLALVAWAGHARAAWQTFTSADGIPQSGVAAMLEDRAGNVWVACLEGLSRYDGWSWHAVDTGAGTKVITLFEDRSGAIWAGTGQGAARFDGVAWSTPAILHDVVAIAQDSTGNMWMIDDSGVSRYDGTSVRTFTTADGLPETPYTDLLVDRQGILWVTTLRGLARFDGTSWTVYHVSDGLANDGVWKALQDRSGALWFSTEGGASRLDASGWQTYFPSDQTYGIFEDRAGALWFTTFGSGVIRYDGTTTTRWHVTDGLADETGWAVTEDAFGDVWIATENGVSRFDGRTWEIIRTPVLGDNRVHQLLVDRRGGVWTGTNSQASAISRWDGVDWRVFRQSDGLAGDQVTAVTVDHRGDLWVGTRQQYDIRVNHYDGHSWQAFPVVQSFTNPRVNAIVEDHLGRIWVATNDGVSLYASGVWDTLTVADGLANDQVHDVYEDRDGALWFATDAGVSRFANGVWTTYTTDDGLWDDHVEAITQDSQGRMWFGTARGVSRFDGSEWFHYTSSDGLSLSDVLVVFQDRSGNMWFGGRGAVSRFGADGSWTVYWTYTGFPHSNVYDILQDRAGVMWFATNDGVSRFDGELWVSYGEADGLGGRECGAVAEDSLGVLWFGCNDGSTMGLTRHYPDRVAPRTVVAPDVPTLTGSGNVTVPFRASLGEARGVTFAYALDGAPWSAWAPSDFWIGTGIPSGQHVFRVKSRDAAGNVDPEPAEFPFEVDAIAPPALLNSPAPGEALHGMVSVQGSAEDPRFRRYRLEARPAGDATWSTLMNSSVPVHEGLLSQWDTTPLREGNHELRLSVEDTLGLVGATQITVVVDNLPPFAFQTSPARILAAAGGDVYTTFSEAHLYLPPHGLTEDAVVVLDTLPPERRPAELPAGATAFVSGWRLDSGGVKFAKAAVLDLAIPSGSAGPALYQRADDGSWSRLGGTIDAAGARISAPLTSPGSYALLSDAGPPAGGGPLSQLSFTPRVFSPRGAFGAPTLSIGFTLGRSGSVDVTVFSRSGRMVRRVAQGMALGAGANLVRWDGRDRDGAIVDDGLYLVVVESRGERRTAPIAVAN